MTKVNQMPVGYKQTDVGVIPEDWDISAFRDLVARMIDYRGVTPKKLGMDWGRGNIQALSANNVQMGQIDFKKECYLASEKLYKRWMRNGDCSKGDVVMTMEAPLGNVASIPNNRRYILSQRTILIKTKELIDKQYLENLMRGHFFQKSLSENASGSTAQGIQRSKLEKILVYYPKSKKEQGRINKVLLDTDSLITKLSQLIQKKRNIKRGAMQELLTGKRRLAGFEKITGYKLTDIGKIPNDWELNSYSDCFNFLSTATYSRAELNDQGSVMYIHYGDIHTKFNNFLDIEHRVLPKISNIKAKNYSLLQNGDLIMADASEDYQGICKSVELVNHSGKKVISGLHTFALRSKNNLLANGFKGYLHENPIIVSQFQMLATGMKVFGVSKGNLKKILIPTPPKSEQTAITQVLSDLDTEIEALELQKTKYVDLKQGMMQQLLTGKIRLI
jgi:type I restriction enzyme, S subunit